MNIEEERKAFEHAVLPTGPVASVIWNGELYAYSDGNINTLTQDYFEVWLKAKAHAEEMAKLTVKINRKGHPYGSSYPFVVSLFEGDIFNGVLEDFRTTEEAKVWAHANGYRVIE